MMGQRRFDTKLYYNLSLDRLVPQDHLLRQIAAAVGGGAGLLRRA